MAGVTELRVRLLGGLSVEGVPVLSLGSRKARAVLRRLAVAGGGYVSAEHLVDAAWPEEPPVRATEQLGVLVSRLRGVLGAERLERHPAGYALRADWLDTLALRTHVSGGEAALASGDTVEALREGRAAVALLLGPVLPEDDSEPVLDERTVVERLAARARLLAAEAALRTGSAWEAVELATRCRDDDPFNEGALRVQLRALAATSRTSVAVTNYLEAARMLREDLGTEPEAMTQQVYLDLLRDRPPERRAGPPAVRVLAGRDEELSRLQQAWGTAVAGDAGLVVVEGPAGIGKSALLEAFGQRLVDAASVLHAVPDVAGAELPLQPVLDALRRALEDRDAQTLLGADSDLLSPLLGLAPTPPSTASAFAAVGTGSGRAVLLAALEALLDRLGRERPVLLLLDDAHLSDETTAQLVLHCSRPGARHRLLVVAAIRAGQGPQWPGPRMVLTGLDRAAVAEVVGADRADDLWARSGGHPLFLAELARHQGDDLPESVLAAVADRCAGTDAVAETLRVAAVLGAPDDVDLLSAVSGATRAAVLSSLEAGVRQTLLVEGERGFAFAHEMFRAAFASGVGPTRAASLHRDAALELHARRTTDPVRVAHHAVLGGESLLAAEALTTASHRASERYEHGEALTLLDRAVALEDTVHRRLARARVLLVLGRLSEAEADVLEAIAGGAGAAGLEVAALVAYFGRDLERALELADEAAGMATDPEVVAGCRCLAGRVLLTVGRLDEGEVRLREAAELATGRMRGVAAVWMANLLTLRADAAEAYRLARSGRAAATHKDPAVEPYRAMALGRALASLDRPYEALQTFEQLAVVVERQQVTRFAGRADNFRSWVLRNLGATQAANAASEAAWVAVGEVKDLAHAEAHCHSALDLADAALRVGDLDGARVWLDRMTEAPTTPHVMRWRLDLRQQLLRGRWALMAGEPGLAAELAATVAAQGTELGVRRFVCQARVLEARTHLALGDRLDLDALERVAVQLVDAAPLESWWLLAELTRDTGEGRFSRLAEQRVDGLLAGAGPWADGLRVSARRALQQT